MAHKHSDETVQQLTHQGAKEAAEALSRMLGQVVQLGAVGRADIVLTGRRHQRQVIALGFETSGALVGQLVFVLDQAVGAEIAQALIGRAGETVGKAALQALAEVGNIAASAFLNGVARQTATTCLPSVPRTSHGPAEQVLPAVLPPKVFVLASLEVDGLPFMDVIFAD